MLIDLSRATFDEFVPLVFDRPARAPGSDEEEWYWADGLEFRVDPDRMVAHLTQLALEAAALRPRFSPDQLDTGFWLLFNASVWREFSGQLWNPAVPWEAREACIHAIPQLWPRLFEHVEVGTIWYMLWDLLTARYQAPEAHPPLSPEDEGIRQAILRALIGQLESADRNTQYAALHGLGHLGLPEASAAVQRLLDSGRWLEPDIRAYAEQARTGDIL